MNSDFVTTRNSKTSQIGPGVVEILNFKIKIKPTNLKMGSFKWIAPVSHQSRFVSND